MINASPVIIDGLKIHEIVIGTGQPVLMLHGWGAHSGLMAPLGEQLAGRGYQLYIPDLPGFGQSDPPPAAWTVFDYAQFCRRYLDFHGLERVYLIGHSFGGRLGLILGADHAEHLHKIALANSAGVRAQPSRSTRWRLSAYRMGLQLARRLGQEQNLRDWYTQRYGSADYKAAQGVMRETFVRVVNEDLQPYAARVAVPTLLFWGDQDQDTPLWQGQLLEQIIPDAGLVVFDGAGHYSYLDRLPDTARIIDYFFKQE